jgi:hypothetical protein
MESRRDFLKTGGKIAVGAVLVSAGIATLAHTPKSDADLAAAALRQNNLLSRHTFQPSEYLRAPQIFLQDLQNLKQRFALLYNNETGLVNRYAERRSGALGDAMHTISAQLEADVDALLRAFYREESPLNSIYQRQKSQLIALVHYEGKLRRKLGCPVYEVSFPEGRIGTNEEKVHQLFACAQYLFTQFREVRLRSESHSRLFLGYTFFDGATSTPKGKVTSIVQSCENAKAIFKTVDTVAPKFATDVPRPSGLAQNAWPIR